MALPADPFDCISPVDYRYWNEDVAWWLSENGFTRFKLDVEFALVKILHRRGLCPLAVAQEVDKARGKVTTAAVYAKEEITRHDIRALVDCLRDNVSDEAKRFIHMTATSFDISDTANAARYHGCFHHVVIPKLLDLHKVLAQLTVREAETPQIGRTHGQHAVPITFGFAVAEYVSRLGGCILNLKQLAGKLVGKFSGAVGAYNASGLFFHDPEAFEDEVLTEMGLEPSDHSTQIVQPEPLARLLYECALTAGVLANLARDMRHLQRTEIGEVGEAVSTEQVGSSTMPQKRNPIGLENVESLWKAIAARMMTVLMDQLSEHQRDLTNSASARTYGEIISYLVSMITRLTGTMSKLQVHQANLRRNLEMQGDMILAEPLYILLAAHGHPDAHEVVRKATRQAQQNGKGLYDTVSQDAELAPYLSKLTLDQQQILADPRRYTGIAAQKARSVAEHWAQQLGYRIS